MVMKRKLSSPSQNPHGAGCACKHQDGTNKGIMPKRLRPIWSLMRMIGSPSGFVLKIINAGLLGGATSMRWALICSQRVVSDKIEMKVRVMIMIVKAVSQRRIEDNWCSIATATNPLFNKSWLCFHPLAVHHNTIALGTFALLLRQVLEMFSPHQLLYA